MDAVTDRDAGSIAGPRPGKPSAKTWAASLIGLGLVAGGVIAGPRLLSSSTPPAVIAPASVAVSVPLRRQVDGRLEVLGQVVPPPPALLVPDTSVLPDQSGHIILTVGPYDVVTLKQVQIGDLRDGLRVIRSGLDPSDRVIIDGIPIVHPGGTVKPHNQPIRTVSE